MAYRNRSASRGYVTVGAVFAAILACLCLCASACATGDANVTTSCGETEGFPGFRSFMPDCRAYELVSPPYESGQLVRDVFMEPPQISPDGNHILGIDLAGFAETENLEQVGFEFGAIYEFSRTAAGWSTEALEPPASQYPRRIYIFASADLSRSLWDLYLPSTPGEELGVPAPNNATLGIREAAGGGKGRFTLVGPVAGPEHEPVELGESTGVVGASADMSHILINVGAQSKQLWPGDTTLGGDQSLYEYHGTNKHEPVLVGVKNEGPLGGQPNINDGAELVSKCGTVLGSAEIATTRNAISTTGEVVYFTAKKCPGPGETPVVNELYARIGGAKTVAISEPSTEDCAACNTTQATREAAPEGAVFQGASEAGSKAFFTTKQELLPGATGETLYEYASDAPAGERVVLVAGDVTHVAAIDGDGSRIYFESTAKLTSAPNANGEEAAAGPENLYVYDTETGRTAFVAQEPSNPAQPTSPVDVTHDGQFAAFSSPRQLLGTNDVSTPQAPQLFEYNADTETVARVSVGQKSPQGYECETTKAFEEGYNCDGNTANEEDTPVLVVGGNYRSNTKPGAATADVSLAADGTVVFMSRDRLSPAAVAGGENIYEYRSGNLYVVSPGDEAVPIELFRGHSRVLGMDESGDDVFFTSTDVLVPQDVDSQSNWFDARVRGGFPASASAPACVAQNCQGPLSAPPPLPAAGGSETAVGGGNLTSALQPASIPKPPTRAQELAKALKACAKKAKKKRAACEAQAKRRFGAKPRAKKSDRRRG